MEEPEVMRQGERILLVIYTKTLPPEEFTSKIRFLQERGIKIQARYDFDRNRIWFEVLETPGSGPDGVFFSKPFYILEHGEYLSFKEKLSVLLPEEFAKTGHMW